MKVFFDNRLIHQSAKKLQEAAVQIDFLKKEESLELLIGWASFLECLGLDGILDSLPSFETTTLYKEFIARLEGPFLMEPLLHLYDRLFAEYLPLIKELPDLESSALIQKIADQKDAFLIAPLSVYKKALKENPRQVVQDIVLYLAWDRVCVAVAIIFETSGSSVNVRQGLQLLKKCLADSFQHILFQGQSFPSFFRLMEAYYAYSMREDNLQLHSDEEWQILCQGAQALKSRESLPDVFYIDSAILPENAFFEEKIASFTMSSEERVRAGKALAMHSLRTLKKEYPEWRCTLGNIDVLCFKEIDGRLIAAYP